MRNDRGGHAFRVTEDQADRRLDRVLRGLFRDVPLAAIMREIRTGGVRRNGGRTAGADRLEAGDLVVVPWAPPQDDRGDGAVPAPGRGPLVTLYRDADIWCVDKPAGLLSQPDRAGGDSVVTRAWAELAWERRDFRPATIHRLDRNVSGVVVIALNARTLRTLSALLRESAIRKIYRAIVAGTPPAAGEIAVPLRKDEARNLVVADEAGREALTRFHTLRGSGGYSLVELELVTGRPHQARAHMAGLGCPIVGDRKYGGPPAPNQRILLHAYRIAFPDCPELPVVLRNFDISAKTPRDFMQFLAD